MGFNRPSKIQEKALPLLLADPPSNLIAQSQSGTGKTAAFVLAMLSRVDPAKKHPQVNSSLSPSFSHSLPPPPLSLSHYLTTSLFLFSGNLPFSDL